MPLDSIMPHRLPEKPWKADALFRLAASVIVCCFMGAVVAMIFRYFGEPHRISAVPFLAFSAGTLGCFAGAVVVLMRPWQFEFFLRKLLTLLLCFYGAFFFVWLAQRLVTNKDEPINSTASVLISVLALQGSAVVLARFFLREHHTGWSQGFGFGTHVGLAILLGVCAWAIALPVTWGLAVVSQTVLEGLNLHPHAQETVEILQQTEGWQNRVVMALATIIIAPIGEEILFRGILYPAIKRWGHPQLAVWVTALLFAAIHTNLETFVPLTFLALVLIWLYEYTGNLLACIITHSLFNAANFFELYRHQS